MNVSLFMRNPEFVITKFMHQVFLAALEHIPLHRPLYCLPRPIKDNLPILQAITFVMTPPFYCISEEASITLLLYPSNSSRHGRVSILCSEIIFKKMLEWCNSDATLKISSLLFQKEFRNVWKDNYFLSCFCLFFGGFFGWLCLLFILLWRFMII